jgi:hypothetical protein
MAWQILGVVGTRSVLQEYVEHDDVLSLPGTYGFLV